MSLKPVAVVVAILIVCGGLGAQSPLPQFVDLFNGRDFTGWKLPTPRLPRPVRAQDARGFIQAVCCGRSGSCKVAVAGGVCARSWPLR